MDRKAIEAAIQVMKRVPANMVDLGVWQDMEHLEEPHETEADAVSCGTSACFAGWLAISPEFSEVLRAGDCGAPIHRATGGAGSHAVSDALGVSYIVAAKLCGMKDPLEFYGKPRTDVTADDVVAKLYAILHA